MILYFSGTGNSAYVAHCIGEAIQDEVVNLFERIRKKDMSALTSETPWVIVVPTYAWRMPRIVRDWLKQTPLLGHRSIYVVMTCGGSIGNAQQELRQLMKKKQLHFMGCASVIMPDNYIVMFDTPDQKTSAEMIQQAQPQIKTIIQTIQGHQCFLCPTITIKDRLSSSIINPLLYLAYIHTSKFYATDDCIGCGQCEKNCPLHTIEMKDDRPIWGKECTHCMACIHHCPKQAIEYGNNTKGRNRYVFPREFVNNDK